MPSAVDLAKRELVKVLRELAEKYGVVLTLTRDSANKDVEKAFRKVSRRAHPDKVVFTCKSDESRISVTKVPLKF